MKPTRESRLIRLFQMPRKESREQTIYSGDHRTSLPVGATRERLHGNVI